MTELTPTTAVEQYIQSRMDATESTKDNHEYRLNYFIQWAEEEGDLHDMSSLSGMDVERFKNWRMDNFDLNLVTLQYHVGTLRVFLRWCESVGAVDEGIADNIIVPKVSDSKKARDVHLSHERCQQIIDYLSRYHYASNQHIIFHILYHTGMRRSSLYACDVEDWHSDEGYLSIRHRPDSGTALKLKEEGERNVSITDETLTQALDDWVETKRPSVEDDHGRTPLVASVHGRLHYKQISKICYKVTRPCYFADECPVGREIESCEGTEYSGYSKCPESVSSHPIRRSAITHHLNKNIPKGIVSERANVSEKTMDLHYDSRTLEDKREGRVKHLEKL